MRLPGSPELRRRIWRIVRIAVGSTLLLFGIVGLVLPVLQGFALILAGLAVLATELPWARRWLNRVRDWIRGLRRGLRQRGGPTGPPAGSGSSGPAAPATGSASPGSLDPSSPRARDAREGGESDAQGGGQAS